MNCTQQTLSQQERPDLCFHAVRVTAEQGQKAGGGLAGMLQRALVDRRYLRITP